MSKTVALLHYSSPPTAGGVESTIYHHAVGLYRLGYQVVVVSGRGEAFHPHIPLRVEPLFHPDHKDVTRANRELAAGKTDYFETLVDRQVAALARVLADADVVLVHNVLSSGENLSLTAAFHRYLKVQALRTVAWCHDLAWLDLPAGNELYQQAPWTLLKTRLPGVQYVAASASRQAELAGRLGIPGGDIEVVPNGVDPGDFYHWTASMQILNAELNLLGADGLLLLPSRIRPHQNIGLGLRVLAELRQQSGQDFRLLVSGPPETARAAHLDELLKQREALGLSDSAHFLYAVGAEEGMLSLDRATVANLYHLADALFYPSRHEGFGSPMLEAALAGRPIFCADIPPFRLLGGEDAHYFDPQTANPATLAGDILAALRACPHFRLRVRTRQHFRWETIIREQVAPLLA